MLKFIRLALGITMAFVQFANADDTTNIFAGQFSRQKLESWQPKAFYNETRYALVQLDGEFVLKAVSENSASGLIREIRVDLEKTPFLNWRWRIENQLAGSFDEKHKTGDDYAARIYVVVSGGFAIWNTKALNYVWAKHSLEGEVWPNAFAKNNAVMTALRSHQDPVSVWCVEKRNIQKDFNEAFGKQIRFLDAVVLMSDTDNTHNKVTAYYGDIYFSAE